METGQQLRAAREGVSLTRAELAEKSGVSMETIKRLEKMDGRLSGNVRTIEAVRSALEQLGVTFEPDNGKGAGLRFFGGDGAGNG